MAVEVRLARTQPAGDSPPVPVCHDQITIGSVPKVSIPEGGALHQLALGPIAPRSRGVVSAAPRRATVRPRAPSSGARQPLRRGVSLRPIARLRRLIPVAALICGALFALQVIGAQRASVSQPAQFSGPTPVPGSARRVDHRLAYIRALLDSAPVELAQSGNVLRPFGFERSSNDPSLRQLNIALLDTAGVRVALLLGDGAAIDAIPRAHRRSLASGAVFRARGSERTEPDPSTTTLRSPSHADSLMLVFVKPVLRGSARCDCLMDADGALVAALSPSAAASLAADVMLADTVVPASAPADATEEQLRGGAESSLLTITSQRGRMAPLWGMVVVVAACIGGLIAWRTFGIGGRFVGRRDQLVQTTFDANGLISNLASGLTEWRGRNIKLETHFNIAPAIIHADRKRLARALRLLMTTAQAAMPTGGTLTLTTRFVETDDDRIDEAGVPAGHYIVLAVADSGRTMAHDRRRRLIDPQRQDPPRRLFGRADSLSLVASIVRAHGWWLSIDGRHDEGNIVQVWMPMAQEALTPLADLREQLALNA